MLVRTLGPWHKDRSEKSVAMPRNGFHIPRMVRRFSQGRPQLGHRLVQAAIEVHERMRRPKLLAQLFAGHHFPGMFQKEGEDLERLFLQFNAHAVLAQLGGAKVYFKDPKTPGSEGTLGRSHDHSPLQQFRERSTPWRP
jgi:hypothetical protein